MRNTTVYSGYLDTYQNDRKLHYVFVQADTNPETAPLTIWLNGGPGCSSMFGYMQEIGPYIVGNTYKFGEDLVKNDYRWNRASNLLFIESPGAVGFSTDTNPDIVYTDKQTADDCFVAIKDFIHSVAP
jgi:cathepsin A (carboxypeptidase C)